MRTTLSLLALAVVSPASAQDSESGGWPHWRGPARDGISRENAWSSTGAPEPLWRAEVGPGYSSFAIADGRLFTLGHDAERELERVLALDASTGELLWEHTYPEPTKATYHGGGSNSTPSVAGGVVHVAGRSGQAFAFDAETGALRWERDYKEELELPEATYGFAGSPVVEGDTLFLALGANLLAVAVADGEVRWRAELGESAGYATPAPFLFEDEPALAVMSGQALVVVAASTGTELQRFPFSGDQGSVNACTPIVADGDVFISAAYGNGAARVRLHADGEPEQIWFTRRMRNKVSGCTLVDGYVYGFDESMLKCIAFEDGREMWRVRGLGMGAVAVAGDRLLVLTSGGELIVAECTPEAFRELSRAKVLDGGVYWTNPVLVDGRVYARNSLGDLVCLDHRSSVEVAAVGEAASDAPLPVALELFAGHAIAVGADALATHTSLHLDGTFESAAAGITRTDLDLDYLVPDRWRMEWDLAPYGTAHRAFNGAHGWQADPFYGTFLYEDDALREAAETGRLHAAFELAGLANTAGDVERGTFGGREAVSVAVSSLRGARRTYWFDEGSGLLVGREAEGEAQVRYEDYRDFGGVLLATTITTMLPDTGVEERIRVESATWDEVELSLFEPPPAIARKLRSPEEKAAESERLSGVYGHLFGRYSTAEGPPHDLLVEEGALVLRVGEQVIELVEPDAEGHFAFLGMDGIYCRFDVGEDGGPRALIVEGFPGEEPFVLERVEEEG